MLKALRFALVALATLSSVMFASPASAGMISTPKPASDSEQRDAAKELLKSRLSESGAVPPGFAESVDLGPRQAEHGPVFVFESKGAGGRGANDGDAALRPRVKAD